MADIKKINIGTVSYEIHAAKATADAAGNTITTSYGASLSVSGQSVSLKSKSGDVLSTITTQDTNTWRPLGTTADTACAGNDSRLSNSREPYFANNKWYVVGDDSYIGDHNVGGNFCIKGANGTPGVTLYNSDDTVYATVIHSANIGSQSVNYANSAGSATNADKLDGYHGSSSQEASTYVLRNGDGYIFTNYINSNTSNSENPTISQIIVTNGSDNYYRKASLAHLKSSLGSMPASGGYADSAGNADTLDSYHGSSSQTANTYVLRDGNGSAKVNALTLNGGCTLQYADDAVKFVFA